MFYEKFSFRNWLLTIKMALCLMYIVASSVPRLSASMSPPAVGSLVHEIGRVSPEQEGSLPPASVRADDVSSTTFTEGSGDESPQGGAGVSVVGSGGGAAAVEAASSPSYNAFFPIYRADVEANKLLEKIIINAYMTRIDYSTQRDRDDRSVTVSHILPSDRGALTRGVAFILYHHPFDRFAERKSVLPACVSRLGLNTFVLPPYANSDFLNNFGIFAYPDEVNEDWLKVDESHSFNHRMLFENLEYAFIKNIKIQGRGGQYFYLHQRNLNEHGREQVLIKEMDWYFYNDRHARCGTTIQEAALHVFGKELLEENDITSWYVELAIPMGWLRLGGEIEVGFLEVGITCRINHGGISFPQLSHRHFRTFTDHDNLLFGISGLKSNIENLNILIKDSRNITTNAATVIRNFGEVNSTQFKDKGSNKFCYITAKTLQRIQKEEQARREAMRQERQRLKAVAKSGGAAPAASSAVAEGGDEELSTLNVADTSLLHSFFLTKCLQNKNLVEAEANIEKIIRKIADEEALVSFYEVIESLNEQADQFIEKFSKLTDEEERAKKRVLLQKLKLFFDRIDRVAREYESLYWEANSTGQAFQRMLLYIGNVLDTLEAARAA